MIFGESRLFPLMKVLSQFILLFAYFELKVCVWVFNVCMYLFLDECCVMVCLLFFFLNGVVRSYCSILRAKFLFG